MSAVATRRAARTLCSRGGTHRSKVDEFASCRVAAPRAIRFARTRSLAGPVTVRSLSQPKPGWRLKDAVDLVRQGYTAEQVERLTGWAASVLTAQVKLCDRRRTPAPA